MNQSTIKILSILLDVVIPTILVVLAGLFFGISYLKKKGIMGGKKKSEKEPSYKKSKKMNIDKFNVIEDFEDNIIITENKTKFTSGVICEGVSIGNLSSFERNMIESNTLGYNTMVNWDLQYYIQTVQADSEEISEFTRESIDAIKAEYTNLSSRLTQLTSAVAESPNRKEYYKDDIDETKRLLKCLEESLNHKDELMAYCKSVTMPGSEPKFNLYILYSYVYDSAMFTQQLSYKEILKEARNFVDSKSAAITEAMKKCMVTCRELKIAELSEMVHRGYNLKDASIIRFKDLLKTSQFDLYTTTDYFDQSRLMYAYEKISEELSLEEVNSGGTEKQQ